ncbi:ABC-type multidrug transport system ATPase component (plasmid) [Rubrobacter radiotolerans]|uniref:ABC transporter ATP-binding protein n=1 Tax=Rubrobacter radiotolerans TaxID=42256 RepID=A0A023X6X1_RUBRA|nr:ABC transporter ATP-binding protein [Rubrobacter radiotolerans]AHY48192.1 ABC-type multidrug transport system ATPase component [Rubrobacter radiotolerans]MDX5895451.1 ABC transporter ATP-binding protein [Rubrobacter radiotolerans]SMC01843.1 ABC-2 type transport system ATP-binding protein [Rubrobacter radiotolerans DSM 5868]
MQTREADNRKVCPSAKETVIRVRGLRKSYGDVVAVDGVDLDVYRGEIFGILGPEGSGKTTTLEMIKGLSKPDAGEVEVAGYDAVREPLKLKRIVGMQLQTTALFDFLTIRETLELFAELCDADSSPRRIDGLLGSVSLARETKVRVDGLSADQQQRLSLALALVNDPKIVFLDEPTKGLDPQARQNLWDLVEGIRAGGRSVVLATRCAEEAEALCDRVAILDRGRLRSTLWGGPEPGSP